MVAGLGFEEAIGHLLTIGVAGVSKGERLEKDLSEKNRKLTFLLRTNVRTSREHQHVVGDLRLECSDLQGHGNGGDEAFVLIRERDSSQKLGGDARYAAGQLTREILHDEANRQTKCRLVFGFVEQVLVLVV